MSLSPHPLCVHALPSRKQNRENRIKNACLSNSHSNIALSNDKRPLFVQIPATSSASLVSTSLPIQCLRPSNFFFFRGIFAYNFLPNLSRPRSEPIATTFRTYRNHVRNVSQPRSEPIETTFGTYRNHVRNVLEYVPNLLEPPPQRISTTSERIRTTSEPILIRSEPIRTTSPTYFDHLGTY